MKNKAIFLDRDGTINVDVGYTHLVEDLRIIPGAIEGLKLLTKSDYSLIIVTNQSGIGRGMYKEQDYFDFRNFLSTIFSEAKIEITAEYFCPHHPEKGVGKYKINCECRKPKTEMLERAAKDFNLDLKMCWMIGDTNKDIQAGKNAGCKTIHVLTGKVCQKPIMEAEYVAKNLLEAANYILGNKKE